MNAIRATLLLAAVAAAASCKKKDHGDDDNSPMIVPAGPESYAPKGSSPPVVVTFNIAFAENVSLGVMQALFTKIDTVNDSLWNATEGQVRIGHVRIKDNAHPGSKSMDYNSLDLSQDDIVVWIGTNFNGPGIAYTLVGDGRFNRFMGVPSNIANTTFLHELGHFLFELTWPPAPVLVDEYDNPPNTEACIMELNYTPLRWCWTDNHLSQAGQPRSCWEQILIDYPAFAYANTNVAPAPPPAPTVEYTDVP
jgi:hypothetical protein